MFIWVSSITYGDMGTRYMLVARVQVYVFYTYVVIVRSGCQIRRTHYLKKAKTMTDEVQEPVPIPDNLFERFKNYFDTKLDGLKRELVSEQESANEKLTKKLKTSDYTFKKKGHKKQTEFNIEVKNKLESVEEALGKDTPNIEKAKEEINDGKLLIDTRNKLIRIADSSEAGWGAVDEYLENDVADNSDDDKKIKKAQSEATRKQKAKKVKQQYPIKTVVSGVNKNVARNSNFRRFGGNTAQNDVCFYCGEVGHWRRSCPNKSKGSRPRDDGYNTRSGAD